MTRLEFSDGKSHKFWEVSVEGASHTVRYGKIGTDGRTSTKEFGSEAEATASAEKLIQQKTKKGYAPAGDAPTPAKTESPSKDSPKKADATPTKAAPKAAPTGDYVPPVINIVPSGAGSWTPLPQTSRPIAVANDGRVIRVNGGSWCVSDAEGNTLHEVAGDTVFAGAFSPDGTRMAVSEKKGERIAVYDAHTFEKIATRRGQGLEIVFDPTGTRVAFCGSSNVTICGADTLGYQRVLKCTRPQGIRFEGADIHFGGNAYSIVPDHGPSEELEKKPKGEKPDGWKLRAEGSFAVEGEMIVGFNKVYDRKSGAELCELDHVNAFSADGRIVAEFNPDDRRVVRFRRLGESMPFIDHTFKKAPVTHWAASTDGTRIVLKVDAGPKMWMAQGTFLWTQTEFPKVAKSPPIDAKTLGSTAVGSTKAGATNAKASGPTPLGFVDHQTEGFLVYGCQVTVPFEKARALAEEVAGLDLNVVAIPAGDATSTTGHMSGDAIAMAVGVVVASAKSGEQGDSGPATKVTPAEVSATADGFDAATSALAEVLGKHDQKLGDPGVLLVATGPLSLARLSPGKMSTEEILAVELEKKVSLTVQYD